MLEEAMLQGMEGAWVWWVMELLTVAYLAAGLAALAGFVPQALTLWRNPEAAAHTPVSTWLLWGVQTTVFHIYAVLVNGDKVFMLATFFSMAGTAVCLGLLLVRRRQLHGRVVKGRRATDRPIASLKRR